MKLTLCLQNKFCNTNSGKSLTSQYIDNAFTEPALPDSYTDLVLAYQHSCTTACKQHVWPVKLLAQQAGGTPASLLSFIA